MKDTGVREELKRKYEEFRQISFPGNPTESRQLHEISVDLVEYDGHVAGITESVLANAPVLGE